MANGNWHGRTKYKTVVAWYNNNVKFYSECTHTHTHTQTHTSKQKKAY